MRRILIACVLPCVAACAEPRNAETGHSGPQMAIAETTLPTADRPSAETTLPAADRPSAETTLPTADRASNEAAEETRVDTIPWTPRNQLAIAAQVKLESMQGDTIRLTYAVQSAPTSVQPGAALIFRRYAKVWLVGSPKRWVGDTTMVQDSAGVIWYSVTARDMIDPGESLTGFALAGVGAPDLVTLRVPGDVPAPVGNDSVYVEYAPPPPIWIDAAEVTTVGVVPQPTGGAAALLDRLLALSSRACELAWVSSASACSRLNAQLSAAGAAIARGDRKAARTEIDGYLADLEVRRGGEVTESAHALLWPNAKTLREKI